MTSELLPPGLARVLVARSGICCVDGEAGTLSYRGYDIHDLAQRASFEEILHLLWHGQPPDRVQREALRRSIAREQRLGPEVLEVLRHAARRGSPMDAVRTGVSALALADPEAGDPSPAAALRQGLRIQARLPLIVATYHRLRTWAEPVAPDPSLSIAGNLLLGLHGRRPERRAERALDTCLVVFAEHGLGASSFAARIVISTRAGVYAAVTAALAAFAGPLHGGAGSGAMRMLRDIADPGRVESEVERALGEGRRLMGFGHREYQADDPRATCLRKLGAELAQALGDRRWVELSQRLAEVVREKTGRRANGHLYAATMFHYLGIPDDLYPAVLAVARTAGLVAHALEQTAERAVIWPRADYTGRRGLAWPAA